MLSIVGLVFTVGIIITVSVLKEWNMSRDFITPLSPCSEEWLTTLRRQEGRIS